MRKYTEVKWGEKGCGCRTLGVGMFRRLHLSVDLLPFHDLPIRVDDAGEVIAGLQDVS